MTRYLVIGPYWVFALLLLATTTFSGDAFANESIETTQESNELTEQKKGWTFAGFPILNYTSERGFGYGAVAFAIERESSNLRQNHMTSHWEGCFIRRARNMSFTSCF